ncbi:hypothetical protein GOBAR_AA25005 [Gossypium barbadense]|uniref:Uncharacterized protein n=1 Tax=Gossypium barbadense TaxID=3634 RepID=A0A2P5WX41_GOSBA|nr:hypothetical protein GOBAR_AA25005 [Gossypium barbadense]
MACRYRRDGARADALERPSAIRNSGTLNWRTTKAELNRSRIVKVCHDDLKTEGRVEFHYELEVCQLDDFKEEPPWFSRQKGSNASAI